MVKHVDKQCKFNYANDQVMDVVLHKFKEVSTVPHVAAQIEPFANCPKAEASRYQKKEHLSKYREIEDHDFHNNNDLDLVLGSQEVRSLTLEKRDDLVLDPDNRHEIENDLGNEQVLCDVQVGIDQLGVFLLKQLIHG